MSQFISKRLFVLFKIFFVSANNDQNYLKGDFWRENEIFKTTVNFKKIAQPRPKH